MFLQRRLLSDEGDICTPVNASNPDDLCVRITETMDTIERVTKEINEGTVTQETLDTLTEQSEELKKVVKEVEENPEAVGNYKIDKNEMEKKTNEVKNGVDSALDTVKKELDGPGSNVAVIVVGVIAGLIVVMLVAAGGYIGYKKYQQRQNRQKTNYDTLEEAGQSNSAFQMEHQPSPPSYQPGPSSQATPAPRPAPIPSRGVPVLPRVSSRPLSSYGEETGYVSDSSFRPSHASRTTDRSSYPPSSSRPRGLRRIDS